MTLLNRKQKLLPHGRERSDVPPDVLSIFEAAAAGDIAALEVAAQHYDINARDENDMSALHHASAHLRYEAAQWLLDKKIDATSVDKFNRNAAWIAIDVFGSEAGGKMHDMLAPHVYAHCLTDPDAANGPLPTQK